jgi:hypothetical protein
VATPPGGRPYDGGAHQAPGQHSRDRYGFPSATDGYGGPAPHQGQQSSYRQPYDSSYGSGHHQGSGYHQIPGQYRAPEPAVDRGAHGLVRPYAMTGGRTRPRYQLAIEALVSTTADPSRLQGQLPEHQRICHLCFEIKSIAEISALLSLPLGVARILVADLAEAGLVAIHQPGGDESAGGQPDVTLLERVLSGLRKL